MPHCDTDSHAERNPDRVANRNPDRLAHGFAVADSMSDHVCNRFADVVRQPNTLWAFDADLRGLRQHAGTRRQRDGFV